MVLQAMHAAYAGYLSLDQAIEFVQYETDDDRDAMASAVVSMMVLFARVNRMQADDAFVLAIDWVEATEFQLRVRTN